MSSTVPMRQHTTNMLWPLWREWASRLLLYLVSSLHPSSNVGGKYPLPWKLQPKRKPEAGTCWNPGFPTRWCHSLVGNHTLTPASCVAPLPISLVMRVAWTNILLSLIKRQTNQANMSLGAITDMLGWKPHAKCVHHLKTVFLLLNKSRKRVFPDSLFPGLLFLRPTELHVSFACED